MARGLYVVDQLPPIDTADRAAVNTFTTFQDIYGAPQKIIPKSRMDIGLTIDLEAWVDWSTTGTPTMSCGFWFNAAPLAPNPATILCQTQLAAAPVATVTGGSVHMHAMATLRAIGTGAAGGSWDTEGYADITNTVTPFSTTVTWVMPTTRALRTATCDVTADRAIGVGWAWGTSAAANSVFVKEFYAKVMS